MNPVDEAGPIPSSADLDRALLDNAYSGPLQNIATPAVINPTFDWPPSSTNSVSLTYASRLGIDRTAAQETDLSQYVADRTEAPAANGDDLNAEKGALLLDLGQTVLDIAGIFDPTPISDGISGVVSLFRGDWLGAGISVAAMIPYVGDLA